MKTNISQCLPACQSRDPISKNSLSLIKHCNFGVHRRFFSTPTPLWPNPLLFRFSSTWLSSLFLPSHTATDRRRSHINKEIKMWMKTPQTRCFPVCGVYVIWFCYKYRRAFLLFCYSGMPWESSSGFLLDRALEVCFWQLSPKKKIKKCGRRACCFVPSALCN